MQKNDNMIDLRALGASDLMLSGSQAVSPNYFYPLPVIDKQSQVKLDLLLFSYLIIWFSEEFLN